jgi:hypothetical protein
MILSKITGIVNHQNEKSTNSKDFKIAIKGAYHITIFRTILSSKEALFIGILGDI